MTAVRGRFAGAVVPMTVGLVTAALAAGIWGWWNPPPVIEDEASYLLQARIFATFRWTAPMRPLPQFFDQMYVFTQPVLASRYFPGHAILLTPGIWLHWPPLIPLLLVAGTASVFFALARALAGPWTALLAWIIWVSSPGFAACSSSYLSGTTTGFLWLAGWWCLRRWRRSGGTGWLALLSLCAAWGCLTRPLTGLAFAIPAAGFVLAASLRRRRVLALFAPTTAALAVFLIIPVWNHATLGRWWTTPYVEYNRIYFPYEKLGFGEDSAPAAAPLPYGKQAHDRLYREIHRRYTWRALPAAAAARAAAIFEGVAEGRPFLLLFFVVGIFAIGSAARFALGTSALLWLLYLGLAHAPSWIVYYVETFPVLSYVVASGLVRAFAVVSKTLRGFVPWLSAEILVAAAALLLAASAVPAMADLRAARRQETAERHAILDFARSANFRAILFLPCSEKRQDLCDAAQNAPDLDRENVWLVHDLGPEDRRLIDAAPGRIPLRYDAARRRIVRIAG